MKGLILLLITFLSMGCYAQHAKVVYKDSTINLRIREYGYDGIETTVGYMKWKFIKEIVFATRKHVSEEELKALKSYTKVRIEDEPEVTEQQFSTEVLNFNDYYENHILKFQESSRQAKRAIVFGVLISAAGGILASNNKDNSNNTPQLLMGVGSVIFTLGLIDDLFSLRHLTKDPH